MDKINSRHLFVAGSIEPGEIYENRSQSTSAKLQRSVSKRSQDLQLAVNNGHQQHIATGLKKKDLVKLENANPTAQNPPKLLTKATTVLRYLDIDTTGLSDELTIRLVKVGVFSEQSRRVTRAIGLNPHFTDAQKVTLATICQNTSKYATRMRDIRLMMENIEAGRNRGVSEQALQNILNIGIDNPILAMKLAALASELQDVEAVDWICHIATFDQVLTDLRGPNFEPLRQEWLNETLDQLKLNFHPALHLPYQTKEKYDEIKHFLLTSIGSGSGSGSDFHFSILDKIAFDDENLMIHTAYTCQQIMELGPIGSYILLDPGRLALCTKIDDQKWARVEFTYGNPMRVTQRQQDRLDLLIDIYQAWKNFDYGPHDQAIPYDVLQARIDPLSGSETLKALFGMGYAGITISESHSSPNAKQFLCEHMETLVKEGVDTIYVEHINSRMQPLLEAYFNAPADAPMPLELELFLKANDKSHSLADDKHGNLISLVTIAKHYRIRVLGLDNNELSRRPLTEAPSNSEPMSIRAMTVNRLGQLTIQLTARNNGKFVILAGFAHNQTHPGLTRGIPGFSQLLCIPELCIQDDGTLRLRTDDPARRTSY